MEIIVYKQTISFLMSVLFGLLLGVMYAFFLCLKSEFCLKKISKGIFDSIFVISAFYLFFLSFFKFNGFDLRIYHIAGVFFGIILYFFTLNSLFYPVFRFFLKFFRKILKILLYPVRFLCKIVNRIFSCFKKVYALISAYVLRFLKNRIDGIKKILKRRKKV